MRMLRRAAISAGQQAGIVFDRFNRADGDIGTADSGETYTGGYNPIGWVVTSGKAKRASATTAIAGYSAAALELPKVAGDYTVEADIAIPIAGEIAGLFGRGLSSSDCAYSVSAMMYYNSIKLVTIGGDRKIASTLATYAHSLTPGDPHNIRLKLSGVTATIYLDRIQIILNAISAWAGSGYLNVGMVESYPTDTPTVLFDNFRVTHNT